MAAAQPLWTPPPEPAPPVKQRLPKLSIYNSLTRSKKPFVPLDPDGRKITWYACGPTVYDDAHLGHARNYTSTDVIRRILKDYFKFDVQFVMNITDVDDKIILAARQQHFLKQYIARHPSVEPEVLDAATQALQSYLAKNLPLIPAGTSAGDLSTSIQSHYGHVLAGKSVANDGTPAGDKEAKIKMHLKTASQAAEAIKNPGTDASTFFDQAGGVFLPYLDSQYKDTISSDDHGVFTALTKEHEKRFFQDMADLNVQKPDVITRVTEYGPQIVDFVKRIEDNGFAYAHEGSVYYDTKAWEASGGFYARLEPWSKNDQELVADGEGALSKSDGKSFKKSAADFALWKASKAGEPGWKSPWGVGRPGWHIECSAMASDILGRQFDIHSGGIDLAFPHHDNELAQSEAYWSKSGKDSKQWVNYFLHFGHLSIQGAKMSKSLKNFTTIREALRKGEWTPRSLRIAFLLGNWRDGLEITPEVISAGNAWEEKMTNFFLKARDLERNPTSPQQTNGHKEESTSDVVVRQALDAAKAKVNDALCDSFDTLTALRAMSELVTFCNTEKAVSDDLTREVAEWLTYMINVFGLDSQPTQNQLGWSGIDIAEAAKTYVYPLSRLRDEVRRQAITGSVSDPIASSGLDRSLLNSTASDPASEPYKTALKTFHSQIESLASSSAPAKDFLALCDTLRNDTLWDLSIYLEDRDGQPALVRPLSASLRSERAERELAVRSKGDKAVAQKAKLEQEAKERLEKGRLDPKDMFRTEEFSKWDDDGMPTLDKEGKEVAKSRSKKLKKEWDRQKKLHDDYLKTRQES